MAPYWANFGSNSLVGKLIREESRDLKAAFERLLQGKRITAELDERIAYDQSDNSEQAIWGLLDRGFQRREYGDMDLHFRERPCSQGADKPLVKDIFNVCFFGIAGLFLRWLCSPAQTVPG